MCDLLLCRQKNIQGQNLSLSCKSIDVIELVLIWILKLKLDQGRCCSPVYDLITVHVNAKSDSHGCLWREKRCHSSSVQNVGMFFWSRSFKKVKMSLIILACTSVFMTIIIIINIHWLKEIIFWSMTSFSETGQSDLSVKYNSIRLKKLFKLLKIFVAFRRLFFS